MINWISRKVKAVWVRIQIIVYLALSYLLIHYVRFGRWRDWLGNRLTADAGLEGFQVSDAKMYRARICGRMVARMAARSPIELVCLPKSMALHWLLRREGIVSQLHIGVEAGQPTEDVRGLHAWVEVAGIEVPAADSNEKFKKILTLAYPVR